jgi:hypothetical protein
MPIRMELKFLGNPSDWSVTLKGSLGCCDLETLVSWDWQEVKPVETLERKSSALR